ncbi:MAG TPA: NnrU family protein [Micromonosporaceae bacterium]|jgi:protein-S-isoprenylcysteine O-methyltransferase Ste14
MDSQFDRHVPANTRPRPGDRRGDESAVRRLALIAYSGLAYLMFVAVVIWAIVFLASTMDTGPAPAIWRAVLADTGLLLLFAVQHTVMARSGFKRRLARVLPGAAERSTYVLAASLTLGLLYWQWQPMPATIWRVHGQLWTDLIRAAYALGWLVAIAATFMVDHLDFLGLRQAYQRPYEEPPFRERWLYAWVRHPMMLGLLLAFWATPTMSAGHLFFAVAASGYIAIGLRFEERDLQRRLGATYRDYAVRVPALVPRLPGVARGEQLTNAGRTVDVDETRSA